MFGDGGRLVEYRVEEGSDADVGDTCMVPSVQIGPRN